MSRADHLGLGKLYKGSSMVAFSATIYHLHLELGTCGMFLSTLACQLVLPLCPTMSHNKDQAANISPMVPYWNFYVTCLFWPRNSAKWLKFRVCIRETQALPWQIKGLVPDSWEKIELMAEAMLSPHGLLRHP